jgi:glutamate formiminotransferase
MNSPLDWRPEAGGSRVEMVGLVPQSALFDSALHYLRVMGVMLEDTVEQRLDGILGDAA